MPMDFVFHAAAIGGEEHHAVICVRDMSPTETEDQMTANVVQAGRLAAWLKDYLTRPTAELLKELL